MSYEVKDGDIILWKNPHDPTISPMQQFIGTVNWSKRDKGFYAAMEVMITKGEVSFIKPEHRWCRLVDDDLEYTIVEKKDG